MPDALVWIDGRAIIRPALPEDLPPVLTCSPAQMRVALLRAGLLETVNTIAASDPEAAIFWEFAGVFERSSPFIAALQDNPFRPFTAAEIDALFIAARNI
jgi:hypothetical protein